MKNFDKNSKTLFSHTITISKRGLTMLIEIITKTIKHIAETEVSQIIQIHTDVRDVQ